MAAALWGHGWSGKHVCFHCDNKAVVLMIQAHNAHKESLVQLLRCLFFYAAVFHFHFSATHIPPSLTTAFLCSTGTASSGPSISDSIPVITTELGVTSLDSTVCALAANGLSANTSKSYRSGLNRYLSFCASYSVPAFPLSESTLCRSVASLVTEGMSYSTIRLYLSAVRHHQLMEGGPDPSFTSLHRLHYVLRGCRKCLPASVRPHRLPITPSILRLLYIHWSKHANDYDTVCMWAACCVAFFAFLRSGEFTCSSPGNHNHAVLSLQDIAVDSQENPTIVHVTLLQSKTDIFSAGVTIHLGRTGDTLCPVSALLAYLACRTPTPGPLFLLNLGCPLSRQVLVAAVRQTLETSGLEVASFNGHSFQIWAATAAAKAGLPDSTIQQLGRWQSSAFTRYLRPPVQTIAQHSQSLLQTTL